MSVTTSVQTVDRLVKIIDCFSPERPAWSLTEISAHLGLPKSTLHRFLVSLEQHGLLRRGADKRWYLGYRLFVWGNLSAESTDLRHISKPIMRDLVVETGETAILTVYQQREVICLEKVETSQPVRLTLEVGARRPPHAGASSKVLMAHLPQEEIEAIIQENGLPEYYANTITEPDELMAELARIRARGYAVSREETDVGAWGVATAVRDWKGTVIAAIGVAGPLSRFSEERMERYVEHCRRAGQRISISLGAKSDETL